MVRLITALLCSLAVFPVCAEDKYVGSEVCASCHGAIAEMQARTAMAQTWHGNKAAFTEGQFDEGKQDVPIQYGVRREGERTLFSVAKGGAEPLTLPVQSMIGGKRHGISLLLTVDELGGIRLERPAMIEARYALLPSGAFVLSPGFPKEPPPDLEHELGRVLTPGFEMRCLTCHGEPGTLGAGKEGGVRCESCHGPGSAHVASAKSVMPRNLRGTASMEVCAQCHSGFKPRGHSDPVPGDLLISSQVPALRHSECFIQSGERVTCTDCHNPHQDSAPVTQSSVGFCLRCHSLATTQHAAICPVNRKQGCIGCHMPTAQVNSFRVTDHWIRVQAEQEPARLHAQDPTLRSQVIPKREFLRLISVAADAEMKAVTDRLASGEAFGAVARELSTDPSARAGGFLGDVALADMDPVLAAAAAHLQEGSNSGVIQVADKRVMLHRQSQDFRLEADRLFREALKLNDEGDHALAVKTARQALDAYPYQLSALNLMGVMLRQAGDAARASAVLGFAAQTYPQDAATLFNLALAQNSADEIEQLRRVIELDPDVLAAYQSLGTLLYASGQKTAAVEAIRAGLQIDPLSAVLYYDLGLILQEQGDAQGAANALALAARLDPKVAAKIGR